MYIRLALSTRIHTLKIYALDANALYYDLGVCICTHVHVYVNTYAYIKDIMHLDICTSVFVKLCVMQNTCHRNVRAMSVTTFFVSVVDICAFCITCIIDLFR